MPFPHQQWKQLLASDYPFLSPEFLTALESSGSVGGDTGWQPAHQLVFDNEELIAAAPAYIKHHSWGEYVFDHVWANAYQQHGLAYYPKLVCSVPFTPSTGPRLLGSVEKLAEKIQQSCKQKQLSGAHLLFLSECQAQQLNDLGWHIRHDVQFHWHNNSYADFDAFLEQLSASKRKKIRRERRRVSEQNVEFEVLNGDQIDDVLWAQLHRFYCNTYEVRGQTPYLNLAFFQQIAKSLPEQLVVFVARYEGRPVACAICFRDETTLYGRHWGSETSYHSLHFESCYYQGIEYCIQQGLKRFDAGAQGQHKISRGFVAVQTHSAHWLAHSQFNDAIGRFVEDEAAVVDNYAEQVTAHSPYRQLD